VLTLIAANVGLNQSELGLAMGVARSTVVAVIDRLEHRHLVARRPAPHDRRSYALALTPAGEQLLALLTPKILAHERRMAARLSAAEQRQLIDLLQKVAGSAVRRDA
jgi:DNA-binding MarR family transcriptional regulator